MSREETALRPELYYLLSMGLRLPTDELAFQVSTGGFRQHLLAVAGSSGAQDKTSLPAVLREVWQPEMEAEELHELRREYTRLFTAPGQSLFSLYESVARGRSRILFENAQARHAEDCYRRGGLTIEKRQREPADYLPVEMEFASLLTTQLCEEETLLPLTKKQCVDLWQEFYDVHLGGWLEEYWNAVMRETKSGFYRRLAETGAVFAGWEQRQRPVWEWGTGQQKEQSACGSHRESE